MKKLIYLLAIITTLTACDSLVEEEVYSTITASNFYESEEDVYTALIGVYDGIQNVNIWWREFYISEMTGGLMRHQWKPWAETLVFENDESNTWALWKLYYVAISRANAVLSALDKSTLDESVKSKYEAEAKFIRAHVYFNMVRLFGQFPLVTEAAESLDDVLIPDSTNTEAFTSEYLLQRDREAIYAFIIEDFQFAEENLDPSYEYIDEGRVTSGAASGMLAKVYLFMAGYQYDYNAGTLVEGESNYYSLAAEQCEKVINSGSYSLLDDYSSIFEEEVPTGIMPEVLFSIKYLQSAIAGDTGEGNQIVARTGVRGTTEFTPYAWLQCSVNESFWYDWIDHNGKNDNRYERTFLEYYVESDGDTVWYGSSTPFARPMVRKFLTDLGYETTAQGSTDYGSDWIVLRYADVLLMQTEALNEAGGTPTAATLKGINEVLVRAGQDAIEVGISKDELRELVWNERKWELCYEGHHYFDCIRTGRLLDEFALNTNPNRGTDAITRHYIYPIPYNAIEANPTLDQNAGW
jgi:hypothetical protein